MSFEVKGHWRNQWDPVLGLWRKRWVQTHEKEASYVDTATVQTVEEAEALLRQNAIGDLMLQFAHALDEADAFGTEMDNILYFLEKPWKWSGEFMVWDQNGRPMDDSEEGWEAFQHQVEVDL